MGLWKEAKKNWIVLLKNWPHILEVFYVIKKQYLIQAIIILKNFKSADIQIYFCQHFSRFLFLVKYTYILNISFSNLDRNYSLKDP